MLIKAQLMKISCVKTAYRFVQFKSGGHSELVPLLPIPNRTVKRLSADDSVDTHVKVGHCQAPIQKAPVEKQGLLFVCCKWKFINVLIVWC